ncbi:hypothetical protein C8Q74DRAFT_374660 [Fomes fomentarius]|nr:hypothetical protein C8Q74DRAFT_374660 [Fomes fomentarius]
MQFARVNQDIVDSVIDLLQEEPPTLACCALVCRAWRRQVRRVLFAHITLPYAQPYLSVGDIQRRILFDELVNGDPDIALLVKSLTLSPMVPRISGHGCTWAWGYAYNNLCHLSNLRSLTISLLHSESLAEIAEEAVSVFPSLESLSFDQITIPLPVPARVERRKTSSLDSIKQRSYHRLPLRRLALRNLLASRAAMRHESTALVARLHELGEISALTSLELLAAPELTEDWIPHFPLIGRTLRHCAIAVNDVVTSGIFYCSGTAELQGDGHLSCAPRVFSITFPPHQVRRIPHLCRGSHQ